VQAGHKIVFVLLTSSNRDESKGCIKIQTANLKQECQTIEGCAPRSPSPHSSRHRRIQQLRSAAGRSYPSILQKRRPSRQSRGQSSSAPATNTHTLTSILCGTSEFRDTAANSPPISGRVDTPIELCLFRGAPATSPAASHHRFVSLSTGGVGGGRPCDSTRMDHSTCTSSHGHDFTSS
jgi:hypothetical protein